MTIDELDESLAARPQDSAGELPATATDDAPHAKSSAASDLHRRRFGRIIAVDGSQATAAMEHYAPGDDAVTPSILQIGAVVKIPTLQSVLFAMIRKLSTPDPPRQAPYAE